MQNLTGIIIAVVVCFSAIIHPAMGAHDATVDVQLTIEEYLCVHVLSDIGMNTVESHWFGQEDPIPTSGTALVDVYTNIDATLRCPRQTTLTADGGAYTVGVQTALLGPSNPVYLSGSYWCLDFEPGAYPGMTTVTASLSKIWDSTDAPGIYHGTVALELIPKP